MKGAIAAEQIVKELHQLWRSLAEQGEKTAVVRACAMTLLVATEEEAGSAPVGDILAPIMREHPCRAIVIRVRQGSTGVLEHEVLAQCWRPFGNREQICCEQIEIAASPDMLADVTALLPGLIAPDLPVALWSRPARLLAMPEFHQLPPFCDKLIFDSGEQTDARASLGAILRAIKPEWCVLGDLNWTRVTRWREALAQAFETPENRSRIGTLSELSIGYKTATTPITALYLAAWVEHVLGRAIRTRFYTTEGTQGRTIQEVRLSGTGIAVEVMRTSGNSVELRIGDLGSGAVFPPHPEYRLVGEELSLLEPDPIYDIVLRRAYELT